MALIGRVNDDGDGPLLARRGGGCQFTKGPGFQSTCHQPLGTEFAEGEPNIPDGRQSPADPLAKRLASWGADISYHDPFVPQWKVQTETSFSTLTTATDLYAAATEADAVVLLQSYSVYDLDRLVQSSALLLDTRGMLQCSETVHRL